MQVRIEDVSPVEKKMFVEVPWETVSQKLGDAYRELGKGVALKGFRKGKVPRPVLEQVYGQRVHAEVAFQLVRESFFRASEQHKLEAVAEPRVEDSSAIKKGQPFKFAAIIEIRGNVEVGDYSQLAIERRRINVPETEVDNAIAQLRREHTELRPVEGRDVTAAGDVVGIKITGSIGEHQVNQPQFAVDLDDEEREPLPGLRQALLGQPMDTKDKRIEIDIPEDYKDESVRGRKADLTVSFLEVRAKEVPELDDEFAKDTGKAETLEGLRAQIRKDLEQRESDVVHREAREAVLRELIKANQIPVASTLVERAVEMQYARLRQMLGMKPEQRGAKTDLTPEMRERMRPSAADEVRGQLLLDAIGEKEGFAATEDEISRYVEETAKGRNMAPAKLRAEWQRDGRMDGVAHSLRQDKVLNHLVSKAQITEVDQLSQPGVSLPDAAEAAEAEDGHVHGPDCDHDH